MVSSCGAVGGPFMSCGHFPGGKSNTTMKGGRDSQKLSCLFSIAARKNPSRFCSFSDMPDRSAPYTMQTQELRRMVFRNSHLLR
ncbi:unnamed protein product [Sphagnum troendelagicum]|uniref:NADH-plastoquinone oxidoreductase subunit K n=1 Tax=Sphagnum troendelagicum TaxID=128251 RepID=A0ABP0UCX6_9BRYO